MVSKARRGKRRENSRKKGGEAKFKKKKKNKCIDNFGMFLEVPLVETGGYTVCSLDYRRSIDKGRLT